MRKSSLLAVVMLAAALLLLFHGLASPPALAQTELTATPTLTATEGPTPIVTPTPAGCAVPLPLAPGSIIYVRAGILIRNLPTLDGGMVGYTEAQTEYVVVGGPVCSNDYNWWQITGPGNPGWVAEGRPSAYFIIDPGLNISGTPVGCGTPETFVTGESIVLFRGLRVRAAPNLGGLVLTVASEGTKATILDGPVCANSYYWWKVRVTVLDIVYDGWIAQGTRRSTQGYLASEAELNKPVCSSPLAFNVGDKAYVNYYDSIPKHLRASPSLNGTILFSLIDNVPVIIIGGPVCADGYNWWQITVRSNIAATGWLAEGGRWLRVVERITPTPTP